jgi:3-dehydroquinate dehydratase/shikimate dehydrogenase
MVQAEIQEAGKQGAQFIEVRLDFLAKAPDFSRLLANKPCPMLATVRRPSDGGRFSGTEEARQTLLRQAIVSGFDWVDLETEVADRIPRFGQVKRIVSYHNMRETPQNLEEIHARMCKQDADVVKIAVRAQTPLDNLRVLQLLKQPARPTVGLCMGDMGMPARILAGKYGSPFSYAAFNKERGIAPGMPSYREMKSLYHYPRINAQTQVFGVIGDPVAHSLSPLIHNHVFQTLGLNAVYVPFRVPRGQLTNFIKAFDQIPVQGYSVTIPHKEDAVALAQHHDEATTRVQAANTLIRVENGWSAFNTDFQGAIDSLRAHLLPPTSEAPKLPSVASEGIQQQAIWPAGVDQINQFAQKMIEQAAPLGSRTVLILGAGGVARAVAYALQKEGAVLTIANRTRERAQKLAEEVGCRHIEWEARHSVICDTLINCTSVGMHPNVDESPMHPSFFKPGITLMETVYTPETTLLVKEARSRGADVITGVDLFVRQAAAQVHLFTGRPPPVEEMRKVLRRAISPVVVREDE